MADIVYVKNIGGVIDVKRASAASSATAGGSGASTTVTGTTIDRTGLGTGSMPRSMLGAVIYDATLQSGATLSIGYDVQTAPDGSTWTDYQTATWALAATGPSGGGAVAGEFQFQVDLSNAERYIRINYNPEFSSTGTDTFVGRAVAGLGGFDRLASPNA